MNDLFRKQFIRYAVVALFNNFLAYLVFVFFVFIGLHYAFALLFSNCISVVLSFLTLSAMVFKHKKKSSILKYLILYICAYIASLALIKLQLFFIHNVYIVAFIAAIITGVLSYLVNKYLIFG